MTIAPIPVQKPSQNGTGDATAFLGSLSDTLKEISNTAFSVTQDVIGIRNLFNNPQLANQNLDQVPPSTNAPSAFSNEEGAFGTSIPPLYIGLGLAAVGLLLLFGDR